MRIISGTARGRKLKELEGGETRPTTDRVKESMFNIVQFDIEGRKILDLFGGTGQLGIECLSRGALSAVFVDVRKDAYALIQENLALTGFAPSAKVVQSDYLAFLTGCREKFDLVFLDPPYDAHILGKAIDAIARIDILSQNGIMICESAVETVLPVPEAPYGLGKEYRYGKIKLTTFRRGAD